MSNQTELRRSTLAGIVECCAQESERFFRSHSQDPGYGFASFCRTIVHRNRRANAFTNLRALSDRQPRSDLKR